MSKNFRKCKKFIHSFCLNFDYISCVYFRYSFSADKCSNSSAVLLRFCLLGKHDLRRNRCANDRFIYNIDYGNPSCLQVFSNRFTKS